MSEDSIVAIMDESMPWYSHPTYSPGLNTSLSCSFLADIVSFDIKVGSFQHNSSKKPTGSTSNSLDNLHLPISIITLTACLSH